MVWGDIWADIMAIIAVVINGLPQLILALSLGFALKPTGLAFLVGGIGNALTGSITPISAQAETLTVAGLVRDRTERATSLILAAILMMIMSSFGWIQSLADFAGAAVVGGMMAGVGLILTDVSVDMTKKQWRTGLVSIVVAVLIWIWLKDLVWTIFCSVVASSLFYTFVDRKLMGDKADAVDPSLPPKYVPKEKGIKGLIEELKAGYTGVAFGRLNVWIAALGFVCLNIGSNTAFGNITAGMAGTTQNLNFLSFINSLADIPSAIFGGAPIEAIISGTGAAPHPVWAGVIMMLVLGVMCLTGVVEKIGKFVPAASIAGFLLIIGFLLTFIPNATALLQTGMVAAGLTALGATIITKNPFIGMVCGVAITYLAPLLGI